MSGISIAEMIREYNRTHKQLDPEGNEYRSAETISATNDGRWINQYTYKHSHGMDTFKTFVEEGRCFR